ncbi:MAG: WD-40 repeat [Trebouxia sp. A1-2]|nr:MAG: WD-40 repeat [Trebouxia sp. A1-2]
MSDSHSEPLLGQEPTQEEVPEDLERGLSGAPGHDFRHLIEAQPEAVIRYLEKHGVSQLGSFHVPDSVVFPLIRSTGMITLGSEDWSIDFEAAWRERMQVPESHDHLVGSNEAQGGHWSGMVEVEAHVVNIRNAVAADDEGLLKPLLKRWQDEACSQMVFGLPAVRAVINFKWDSLLQWEEDLSKSLLELLESPYGFAILASEAVALLAMVPFVYLEVCTVIDFGPSRWLSTWNLINLITYILQVAIDVMHVGRLYVGSETLSLFIAAQCLLLWLRFQFFVRVFQPTKNAFVDTLQSILDDVKWSLLFLVLTMWGFAGAFYILFREDQAEFEEFNTIWHSWLTLFSFMMTGFEFGIFYDCSNPEAATILMVLYMFVVAVIFLNLLIGIMADSWKTAKENEGLRFLTSKAGVIDELEYTMPRWLKRRNPGWYPPYVHILRVNPESADEVEMDSMWTRHGAHPGDSILNDKSELNVKLTKLGKQLQANQIMLHEIKATLQQNGLAK